MINRKEIITVFVLVTMLVGISSCSGLSKTDKPQRCDTVSFGKIGLRDSSSYYLNGSEKCGIYASATMTYPSKYKTKEETERLQGVFMQTVLDIPSDTLTLASAFPQFLENQLNAYRNNNASTEEEEEVDFEPVYKYETLSQITPTFNDYNLLCFCKEVVTEKNGKVTMRRHYYYTFNLATMTRVGLDNLFNEEQVGDLNEMLKKKLLKDLNITSEDQLNDLGYFNYDNLVANNNFNITKEGITWNYQPRELSVIEEVRITLSFETLKELITDNSILLPFLNING